MGLISMSLRYLLLAAGRTVSRLSLGQRGGSTQRVVTANNDVRFCRPHMHCATVLEHPDKCRFLQNT
jgi:hypothetical protein